MKKFINLSATGEQLPVGEEGHITVLGPGLGHGGATLEWPVECSPEPLDEEGEAAYIADLNARKVGGHDDWRAADDVETEAWLDRSFHKPACDVRHFPGTRTDDWYRTSKALSANPGLRWFVYFNRGYVHDGLLRGSYGFVRAVRVASPGQ